MRIVKRLWPLVVIGCTACIQKPPQAIVVVNPDRAPNSHAVLVMPLVCTSYADVAHCMASAYGAAQSDMSDARDRGSWGSGPPRTFDSYISPALRLKLEFAGFTLAEARAMRLSTADRIEVNGQARVEETTPGPQTVAELSLNDVREVAKSLQLSSMLLPTLVIRRAGPGEVSGELTIVLVDVETNQPRWTVSCKENIYSADESTSRLANCVGNGVLAILAPQNVIGKAL